MKENPNGLEALFEVEMPTEELIKEARRSSRIRQILVSLGTIVLSLVLIWLVHLQITPYLVEQKVLEASIYQGVVGANRHEMSFKRSMSFFSGEAEAVQYKIVGSEPVVIGTVNTKYDNYHTVLQMEGGVYYSEFGHKLMTFYPPDGESSLVRTEFEALEKLSEMTLVEVGISLDAKTTRSELEKILPEGITLNWCWVETLAGEMKDTVSEEQAIGYAVIDEKGKMIENPEAEWMTYLDLVKDKNTSHRQWLTTLYDALNSGYTEKEELPIIGGVLVGTKSELLKLKDTPGISGLVIGEIKTY